MKAKTNSVYTKLGHCDYLGSTSYITDAKGNITQFDAYLPYGELLVDEHTSSEDMPYKFNGKELDQETGLYYYGARYMNPVTSLWYGVDPMAEKMPEVCSYLYCLGLVQSLLLTSDGSTIIAGSTTYMSSQVNVNDRNGVLKDYSIVATDVTHELLHTLRLGHPFERTQTADTKLLRVGPNSYISTPSTVSNIVDNVMNYPMITIDGKASTTQNSLTRGQLDLMLKEIELQKQGYGIYKYNNKLTNSQNEELYSKYFINYWDHDQWPGYPVQKK